MKICLISNLYEPHARGGAEKIAKLTAEALAKKHDVVVVSTCPYKGFASLKPQESQEGYLRLYRFYPLNIFYYLHDYKHNAMIRLIWHFFDIFNLHSRYTVKGILAKEKPDVVITHNLKGLGYLLPRLIAAMPVQKYIHVLHDVQYAVPSGLIVKGEEQRFSVAGFPTVWYGKLCRWLLRGIDVIISPSHWLLRFYSERVFFADAEQRVMPNPVVLENKKERATRNTAPPYRTFLFLGQIESHKGIEQLVKVMRTMPTIRLRVAGKGRLLKTLQEKAPANVSFLGHLHSAAVSQEIDNCDYVVVPSRCYENSPTVVYEAFSRAKPVVVADIGGAAELVTSDVGYTYTADNEGELQQTLRKAAENVRYDTMAAAALEKVREYSVERYIDNLTKLW